MLRNRMLKPTSWWSQFNGLEIISRMSGVLGVPRMSGSLLGTDAINNCDPKNMNKFSMIHTEARKEHKYEKKIAAEIYIHHEYS